MFLKLLFCLLSYSIFKDPPIPPRKPNNDSSPAILLPDTPPSLPPDMIVLLASQKARSILQNMGEDFRPPNENFPEINVTMERIEEIHIKKKWLDYLNSNDVTEEDKLDMIKKDLEPSYKGFDIYAGGLLNDW